MHYVIFRKENRYSPGQIRTGVKGSRVPYADHYTTGLLSHYLNFILNIFGVIHLFIRVIKK